MSMVKLIEQKPGVFIAMVAAIQFIPFLGGVHLFDWDEINFAEISREMIVSGDYLRPQIGFEPFYEKPPLFAWLQVAAMQVFGVDEFAARLPNALCGVLTLLLLFCLGKGLGGQRLGWLWAAFYGGSILPHLYFRSGIIDPWFNLFIFLGLYHFWKGSTMPGRQHRAMFLAGSSLGAAVLAKGPVAWLIAGLCILVFSLWQKRLLLKRLSSAAIFAGATLLLPLLWFGVELWLDGPDFVLEFVRYQLRLLLTPDAGHRGFPGYHVVVLLLGCFPASLFAIPAMRPNRSVNNSTQESFRDWMLVLFWVVLVLFSLVRTKIVHYSSLCYFPLTYLAAWYVDHLLRQNKTLPSWLKNSLAGTALSYALATLILPWLGQHKDLLLPFLKDPFAAANLQAEVAWSSPVNYLPGIVLALAAVVFLSSLCNGKPRRAILSILIGTAIFVQTGLYCFIGKIEAHTQRAAVEFCQSLAGQEVYIKAIGYKSYVPFFYGRIQPGHPQQHDPNWLLTGPIDRDVWLLTKIHRAADLQAFPELEEVGRKNGFVFFRRKQE